MKLKLLAVWLVLAPAVAAAQGFGRIDESIFKSAVRDSVPAPVTRRQMIVVDSFPCGPAPAVKARKAKRPHVRRRPKPKVAAVPVAPDTTPVKKVVRKRRVHRPRPKLAASKAPAPLRATPIRSVKMCARVRTFGEPSQTLLTTDTSVVPMWTAALAPPAVTLPAPVKAPDVGGAPPVIGPSPAGGFPWLLPGVAIVPFIFGSFVHGYDHGPPAMTPMVPFVPDMPSVVPEPGTLTLVATGLAGLAGFVRRRR